MRLGLVSSDKSDSEPNNQNETDIAIGERIRALRKARNLSLKDTAAKSGLSIGYLSQIERGLSSVSVRALARIADALKTSIADVFPRDGAMNEFGRVVVRHKDRKSIDLPNTGIFKEHLTPLDQTPRLDIYILTLEPGGSSGNSPYAHDGAEAGVVLEGGLELNVDGRKHILGEGDSFRFNSDRPHHFCNAGNRTAKVVWVNSRDVIDT